MHLFHVLLASRTAFYACCLATLGALSACSTVANTGERLVSAITPFQPEIVQGNLVSKEQVDVLQPGMSRNQVRDILGSPLLASVFHNQRWDYTFTLRRSGVEAQARRLTVYFNGDVVERIEGDAMPSEAEFVSKLASGRDLGKIPPLVATPEDLQKFRAANPGQPAAARPVSSGPAATSYPPLERPAR